jgi:hypothetical protein
MSKDQITRSWEHENSSGERGLCFVSDSDAIRVSAQSGERYVQYEIPKESRLSLFGWLAGVVLPKVTRADMPRKGQFHLWVSTDRAYVETHVIPGDGEIWWQGYKMSPCKARAFAAVLLASADMAEGTT